MTEYRVKSASLDKLKLTLYLDDGEVVIIKQGDYRLSEISNMIMPIIARGEIAVFNAEEYSVYSAFEKKSNGLVRFFRVAKDKVKHLLGLDEEPPMSEGEAARIEPAEPKIRVVASNEDIIKDAQPMGINESVSATETVIAVTKDNKILPNAERLKTQFQHSTANSTKGMEAFLERVTRNIDKYSHSVADLTRFLENGDLPIADDGSIIGYKMLNHHSTLKDTFVDCHSGKVIQKVGSYVVVDPSMVDRNRRNECSNGLHIARRGYLRSFGGAVCVICKIPPEDVVTVPHGDPNKVRVCSYHILGVLPQAAVDALKAGKPMTHIEEAAKLLSDAITGNHIGRIEEVRIGGSMGSNLTITPLGGAVQAPTERVLTEQEVKAAKALDDAKAQTRGEVISPKDARKSFEALEAKVETEAQAAVEKDLVLSTGSNAQKARWFFDQKDWVGLTTLKAKAKVSYTKLGLSDAEIEVLKGSLNPSSNIPAETLAPAAESAKEEAQPQPVAQNLSSPKTNSAGAEVTGTNKEKARAFYNTQRWEDLVALKKSSKISYEKLGLTVLEEEDLLDNLDSIKSEEPKQQIADKAPQVPVVKQDAAPEPKKKAATKPSNKEQALAAYDAKSWLALASIKSKTKVSWEKLGFTDKQITEIKKNLK